MVRRGSALSCNLGNDSVPTCRPAQVNAILDLHDKNPHIAQLPYDATQVCTP